MRIKTLLGLATIKTICEQAEIEVGGNHCSLEDELKLNHTKRLHKIDLVENLSFIEQLGHYCEIMYN